MMIMLLIMMVMMVMMSHDDGAFDGDGDNGADDGDCGDDSYCP